MVLGLTKPEIAAIRRWAKSHPEIQRVYLFGSRAKGTHDPDSDVDLAIQVDACDDDDDGQIAYMDFKKRLGPKPNPGIDPCVNLEWYSPDPAVDLPIVKHAVHRDGVLLFDRNDPQSS